MDRLHQLRIIKLACESLTPAEPQLPEPGSPLPALLALRMAQRTIEATKSSLVDVESRLASVRKRLEKEEANLHDSILITSALENRIAGLRETLSQESRKTLDESVNDLLESIQSRKVTYDRDVKKLVKAFNRFINSHLAPMLSAEEHGGPVVGGLDEQELHGGAQGKRSSSQDLMRGIEIEGCVILTSRCRQHNGSGRGRLSSAHRSTSERFCFTWQE